MTSDIQVFAPRNETRGGALAPELERTAGQSDNARDRLLAQKVKLDLAAAVAEEGGSSRVGEPVVREELAEVFRRHGFFGKALDTRCRHVDGLIVAPCNRLAILDHADRAKQRRIIAQRPIEFERGNERGKIDRLGLGRGGLRPTTRQC